MVVVLKLHVEEHRIALKAILSIYSTTFHVECLKHTFIVLFFYIERSIALNLYREHDNHYLTITRVANEDKS